MHQQCGVLVVGAGIAGLAAASELKKTGHDVVVVEAADYIGGRIKQESNLLPFPVELGPQFIHGKKSIIADLIQQSGCEAKEYEWPDQWYFTRGKQLLKATDEDGDIAATMEAFDNVSKLGYPAKDLSAESWLRSGGANERMIDIAEACYANDFGCSLSQMGMRETILENRKWDSGEEYLVLNRPLSALTDHLCTANSLTVLKSWPVTHIDYSKPRITARSLNGQTIHCSYVVIAIPLKMLQRQDIHFVPRLPPAKQAAIERIQMSNAIKVIIVLDKQIWPDDFFDVVCPGGFVPEFWVLDNQDLQDGSSSPTFFIVGFIAGKKAELLSQVSQGGIISKTLAQLDEIFGSKGKGQGHDRYPATNAYVKAHIADWSKERYIGGAYSYPSLGAEIGDREKLAESVSDRLFFAGEATHPAVNPCLQAAYETGLIAAKRIVGLSKQHSRL